MAAITIAVAGASASDHPASMNVGGKLAKELLKNGAHVRVLSRKESADKPKLAELKEAGAEVVAVDYADPTSLDKALKGADIVVSTLAWDGMKNQKALAEAAKRQDVKLFLPSEWGNSSLDLAEDAPIVSKMHFHQVLKDLQLPYLLIFHGPYSEILGFMAGPKEGRILLPEGGKAQISTTSVNDATAWAGYVLTHVPIKELSNRYLVIEGSRTTLSDLAKIYTQRDPSIKVEDISLDELDRRWRAGDFLSFFLWKWHNGHGVDGTDAEIKSATSLYPAWKPKLVTDFI